MLTLTCSVLYSRQHPWVSRVPAGLKGVETSFIALTAHLETVLQLSSSSVCLQSDVALTSCLTITSAGTVVCTLSGPQEGTDFFILSKTISTCINSWRPKANLCLWALVFGGGGYVWDLPVVRGPTGAWCLKWVLRAGVLPCRGVKTVSVASQAAFTPSTCAAVQTNRIRKWKGV